jgi:hypothetical protein
VGFGWNHTVCYLFRLYWQFSDALYHQGSLVESNSCITTPRSHLALCRGLRSAGRAYGKTPVGIPSRDVMRGFLRIYEREIRCLHKITTNPKICILQDKPKWYNRRSISNIWFCWVGDNSRRRALNLKTHTGSCVPAKCHGLSQETTQSGLL